MFCLQSVVGAVVYNTPIVGLHINYPDIPETRHFKHNSILITFNGTTEIPTQK